MTQFGIRTPYNLFPANWLLNMQFLCSEWFGVINIVYDNGTDCIYVKEWKIWSAEKNIHSNIYSYNLWEQNKNHDATNKWH